jgi:hypothetical protein
MVACKDGTTTTIASTQVMVEGKLHVREDRDGEYVVSIFQVTEARVRTPD